MVRRQARRDDRPHRGRLLLGFAAFHISDTGDTGFGAARNLLYRRLHHGRHHRRRVDRRRIADEGSAFGLEAHGLGSKDQGDRAAVGTQLHRQRSAQDRADVGPDRLLRPGFKRRPHRHEQHGGLFQQLPFHGDRGDRRRRRHRARQRFRQAHPRHVVATARRRFGFPSTRRARKPSVWNSAVRTAQATPTSPSRRC